MRAVLQTATQGGSRLGQTVAVTGHLTQEIAVFPSPAPADLAQRLQALEESLLQPDVRRSAQLVALLADEFIEFGSSGRVYTKADLVAVLQAEVPSVQTVLDFQVWLLAPQAALLTYVVRRDAAAPVHTLRSSVWQLRGERWLMVFHQATVTSEPHAALARGAQASTNPRPGSV